VTRLQAGNRGICVRFSAGARYFCLLRREKTGSGVHPTFLLRVPGTLLSEVRSQSLDLTPPSAKVNGAEIYIHFAVRLHGVVLNETQR
jgi:hypothetical protein